MSGEELTPLPRGRRRRKIAGQAGKGPLSRLPGGGAAETGGFNRRHVNKQTPGLGSRSLFLSWMAESSTPANCRT